MHALATCFWHQRIHITSLGFNKLNRPWSYDMEEQYYSIPQKWRINVSYPVANLRQTRLENDIETENHVNEVYITSSLSCAPDHWWF